MTKVAGGVVHTMPKDLREAITASPKILTLWNGLTPLARNEWICWVTSVKKEETRATHVKRVPKHLMQGQRRPCCWAGCTHR